MYKFKKIFINENPRNSIGASLFEISNKDDCNNLKLSFENGFKGAKSFSHKTLAQIIKICEKYSNLLFDDYDPEKTTENLVNRAYKTAVRLLEVIFNANGYFWVIEDAKGDVAGFFYLYDVISIICPKGGKCANSSNIQYDRKPHCAVLAGSLKKDFWGIESKKIMKQVLNLLFDEENFKKIKCEIFASNPYVKGILKRFKFRQEGVLKDETINRGKLETVEIWSLLKYEFENL